MFVSTPARGRGLTGALVPKAPLCFVLTGFLPESQLHIHARVQQAQDGDAAPAGRVEGDMLRDAEGPHAGSDFFALATDVGPLAEARKRQFEFLAVEARLFDAQVRRV